MLREEVIRILADVCRKNQYLSVATMQATPVWHALDPEAPLHIDMLGCMGSASSLGLGMALGAPDKRVVTVDGDGCVTMQLATLVTIGEARARNYTLIVMNNGLYETSGNQPIPGAATADFVALAQASGFRNSTRIDDVDDLRARIATLIEAEGPNFIALNIDRASACKSWPTLSMRDQIQAMRRTFGGAHGGSEQSAGA
ncbi:hypothetical protein GXB81_08335 [Paraburkholderia sp. Ac-20336]|uniref:thiamine pyrophosphate-dependent enzyme n=1 Tax=Burkholderiaceae TaxID=119060 RepID=UPI0014239646|nr:MULTISPECIES: thiamine pyrophosphate-dependent enzyme [Burkholderiaceae]MBN3803060.1 hypothetical protein [Paraburkholderia sp. Ac-20336]